MAIWYRRSLIYELIRGKKGGKIKSHRQLLGNNRFSFERKVEQNEQ